MYNINEFKINVHTQRVRVHLTKNKKFKPKIELASVIE